MSFNPFARGGGGNQAQSGRGGGFGGRGGNFGGGRSNNGGRGGNPAVSAVNKNPFAAGGQTVNNGQPVVQHQDIRNQGNFRSHQHQQQNQDFGGRGQQQGRGFQGRGAPQAATKANFNPFAQQSTQSAGMMQHQQHQQNQQQHQQQLHRQQNFGVGGAHVTGGNPFSTASGGGGAGGFGQAQPMAQTHVQQFQQQHMQQPLQNQFGGNSFTNRQQGQHAQYGSNQQQQQQFASQSRFQQSNNTGTGASRNPFANNATSQQQPHQQHLQQQGFQQQQSVQITKQDLSAINDISIMGGSTKAAAIDLSAFSLPPPPSSNSTSSTAGSANGGAGGSSLFSAAAPTVISSGNMGFNTAQNGINIALTVPSSSSAAATQSKETTQAKAQGKSQAGTDDDLLAQWEKVMADCPFGSSDGDEQSDLDIAAQGLVDPYHFMEKTTVTTTGGGGGAFGRPQQQQSETCVLVPGRIPLIPPKQLQQ